MSKNKTVAQQLPDYLEQIWRFAYRLSQSQDVAQELTQKTCLRALEYQSTYRDGNLKSWLFKIMHNLWIDEVRSDARAGLKVVDNNCEAMTRPTYDGPEQQILLQEVQSMITQLPEAQRTVLLLVAAEGFSYKETAELLGVPIGTVMSRLARAREKIGEFVYHGETANSRVQSQGFSCKK